MNPTIDELARSLQADVSFDCPRCGTATEARFYGPCPNCAQALGQAYPGLGRNDIEAPEYEPKMNVTPNAVATKD